MLDPALNPAPHSVYPLYIHVYAAGMLHMAAAALARE